MIREPRISHRQENGPARLRGDVVSSALFSSLPLRARNLPAWPSQASQACRQLGWWSDDLTQSVALWGNFGKNAFPLDFRNKFDL